MTILWGSILGHWSNSACWSQSTTKQEVPNQEVGFVTERVLFDSLIQWVFTRKKYDYQGTLTQADFFKLTRTIDTISPEKIVYGQFMQYRWKVFKGIQKAQKRALKRSLRLEKLEFYWNKRITYDQRGTYLMRRIEVPFQLKKKKYTLRFEALNWEGVWYHVGRVEVLED